MTAPTTATTTARLTLPTRGRGRLSAAGLADYRHALQAWCDGLLQIKARLDFTPGVRGWCYILEQEHGLPKGEFSRAERLITDCRKSGLLPLDFCAVDQARTWDGHEQLDGQIDCEVEDWLYTIRNAYLCYTPTSFWADQPYFLMLLVEKIDLKALFSDLCRRYRIPIANAKGWADLHTRASMMRSFQEAERLGQRPVLLTCGDFDPAGLLITDSLRANLTELTPAVGWHPDQLIIDRFGLTREFIDREQLPWIDGLETGSGESLADPDHRHHQHQHVQQYLRDHGPRKVEANALVVRPDAARALFLSTITKYVPEDAPEAYETSLHGVREDFRDAIATALRGEAEA